MKGEGRGRRRKGKGSRRGVETGEGRGEWKIEGRKGVWQQFRSEVFFFAGAVRARSSDGHQSIGLDCPFPRMRIK